MSTFKFVPGTGSSSAKLMIVGEAPGEHEEIKGETLVGPTGLLTREMIELAGYKWNETYRTNVLKYRPPNNDLSRISETGHSIEECKPILWNEVNTIKPNVILAIGDLALTNLTDKTGITKWRGSILESKQGYPKIIPSFHPARLWKHEVPYNTRVLIQWDFDKAVRHSSTPEFNLPRRCLEIARSSADLYRFLSTYRDNKRVSVDIEVYKGIPTCIALAFSAHHAMSIPVLNMEIGKNPFKLNERELCECLVMLAEFLERDDIEIIGQNFKFDKLKLLKPLQIRIKKIFGDTKINSAVLYPELKKDLALLTSIYTDEPYYKDEYKEFNEKRDSFDRVMLYNAKDSAVTYEVFEKQYEELTAGNLLDFAQFLMDQHPLYEMIDREGFSVDLNAKAEVYRKYIDMEKAADDKLEELIGRPFNVRSNPQVKKLIEEELKLPAMASYGEDNIVNLIGNNKVKDNAHAIAVLDQILLCRRIKIGIGNYIEADVDYDGRLRTLTNPTGTGTGRSSTGILSAPERPHQSGISYHSLPEHGISSECKRYLKADNGYVILGCDLSQAEPRIVGHLAKDEWLNNLYKQGKDVHRYTAQLCFNLSDEERDKLEKNSDKRFIGKTVRNAGHYDAKARKLRDTINSDARKFGLNITINQTTSQILLDTFHRKSPNIVSVFHAEVKEALKKNNRTLINPFGRPRQSLERFGEDMFREMYAQLPQSTVKDHLGHVYLRLRNRKISLRYIIEWHDAYYWMIKDEPNYISEIASIIKEEFERPISFERCSLKRDNLILPCEFSIGQNLYEMRSLRVA
jgi:uracil-DNA glycosylase family 4